MLTDEEKTNLLKLRDIYSKNVGPQFDELRTLLDVIDLSGISTEDLKALTIPEFVVGVDFSAIDTSSFTTKDMNTLAPGSIEVGELKAKITNKSLVKGRVTDLVDTQSGIVSVINEIRDNIDIEDLIELKSKSQGTNMQLINKSLSIDKESVKDKEIVSRFLE